MTPEREQQLLDENTALKRENELLRPRLELVLRKLFGKSSEALDPAQLELLLGEPPGKAPASFPQGDAPSAARTERKPQRERIPDHLPVVEEVLLPEAVKACPDAWRRIVQEHSDSLDYQPGKVFIRRLVRPVFVKVADRDAAPVTAKLPPRLQDGLTAAPGLIAHLLVSKYCDHLPLYRQETILATRHGVDIGRNTMCRWAELATFWLRPLYQRIHEDLLESGYLQADETPIKYLATGTGKTSTVPAAISSVNGILVADMPASTICSAASPASSSAMAMPPTTAIPPQASRHHTCSLLGARPAQVSRSAPDRPNAGSGPAQGDRRSLCDRDGASSRPRRTSRSRHRTKTIQRTDP